MAGLSSVKQLLQSLWSTVQDVSLHRYSFFTAKSSRFRWKSRVNMSPSSLILWMSDRALGQNVTGGLVLKHMYMKVKICKERVLVGSNPPARITHVFHGRLKGPTIACLAV